MNDKQLDDLLNAPLIAVADDGFSVRLMRRMQARHRRMQFLQWGLILAALLPVLIALPLADWGTQLADNIARAAAAPLVSYIAGALALLWVWKPRFFTR